MGRKVQPRAYGRNCGLCEAGRFRIGRQTAIQSAHGRLIAFCVTKVSLASAYSHRPLAGEANAGRMALGLGVGLIRRLA